MRNTQHILQLLNLELTFLLVHEILAFAYYLLIYLKLPYLRANQFLYQLIKMGSFYNDEVFLVPTKIDKIEPIIIDK